MLSRILRRTPSLRTRVAFATAIGAAIAEALRAGAGRQLAGVIVLSDGAQHAYPPRDEPPQTAARAVGDAGVPLWSVTFGQQLGAGQGRDAAIVNLSVGETVYLKNQLEVAGRVRLEGLADRDAVVKLLAENDTGGMEEVARTTVKGGAEVEEAVRLAWTPQSLGERKLSLVVERHVFEHMTATVDNSAGAAHADADQRLVETQGLLGGLEPARRILSKWKWGQHCENLERQDREV